jgi:hypothetical protein
MPVAVVAFAAVGGGEGAGGNGGGGVVVVAGVAAEVPTKAHGGGGAIGGEGAAGAFDDDMGIVLDLEGRGAIGRATGRARDSVAAGDPHHGVLHEAQRHAGVLSTVSADQIAAGDQGGGVAGELCEPQCRRS